MAHQRRSDLTNLLDTLTAVVRGDATAMTALAASDPAEVCRLAEEHGLLPLVAERMTAPRAVPNPLDALLRREAARAMAHELVIDEETRQCVAGFKRDGVPALLMKGADLAAGLYPRADLRPRCDTDVLVAATARHEAAEVLTGLGYSAAGQITGDLVTSQATYTIGRGGVRHAVDVHWRIANAHAVANLLTFEELDREAVPLPALGSGARGLCPVHALLLACVHRIAHHYDSDRRIWLYDIHLLAGRMSEVDWTRFRTIGAARGVAAECRLSLTRAADAFHTLVPDSVWRDPAFDVRAADRLGTRQQRRRGRQARLVASDLQALASWRDRWTLVREHAFPTADYMRHVYAPSSGAPLVLLYARRALHGARKWLWTAQ